MKNLRSLLILSLLLLGSLVSAHAQIAVEISIKNRLHIRHEPVLATVLVTNNTGREITLQDSPQAQWFGFQITTEDGSFIPPRNLDYHLDPLTMRAGETVKRTVNLNELYTLGEYGIYRIRANIYSAGMDRDFSSKPTHIEITEGRKMWQQAVGVPEGMKGAGQTHVFTMLAHQRGEQNVLYVRAEDQDDATVFCTYGLGRMVDGVAPQMQFDTKNSLHVLQLVGQRTYALSRISVNGEFLGQTMYNAPKTRPYLRKQADGTLELVGGQKMEVVQPQNPADLPTPVKLSDRPVPSPYTKKQK